MLTLHHLQISQSERITWLLEELSIPYNLVLHVRDPILSPQSLLSTPGNKTGRSPFLTDSSTGASLTESGAIVEYIIQTYGQGRLSLSPGHKNYADYLQWYHYANGTLQSEMLNNMIVPMCNGSPDSTGAKFVRGRLDAAWKLLDERLGEARYLAGDEFTAADIMTVYCATIQRSFGPQDDLSGYPNLLRWLSEVTERPASKRAMDKADPEMKVQREGKSPQNLGQAGGVPGGSWKK